MLRHNTQSCTRMSGVQSFEKRYLLLRSYPFMCAVRAARVVLSPDLARGGQGEDRAGVPLCDRTAARGRVVLRRVSAKTRHACGFGGAFSDCVNVVPGMCLLYGCGSGGACSDCPAALHVLMQAVVTGLCFKLGDTNARTLNAAVQVTKPQCSWRLCGFSVAFFRGVCLIASAVVGFVGVGVNGLV